MANSNPRVATAANNIRIELYTLRLPNSAGVKSRVSIGESRMLTVWPATVPANITLTLLAKLDPAPVRRNR